MTKRILDRIQLKCFFFLNPRNGKSGLILNIPINYCLQHYKKYNATLSFQYIIHLVLIFFIYSHNYLFTKELSCWPPTIIQRYKEFSKKKNKINPSVGGFSRSLKELSGDNFNYLLGFDPNKPIRVSVKYTDGIKNRKRDSLEIW